MLYVRVTNQLRMATSGSGDREGPLITGSLVVQSPTLVRAVEVSSGKTLNSTLLCDIGVSVRLCK